MGTLNFITWKGTDHINQEGNINIKPSYAFQCFSPGVENFNLVWDWQSVIFENACVQCEQWHSPHHTCNIYNSSDVRFFEVGFGCLCFLQDMAITSRKFRPKRNTINKWSMSAIWNLMGFEKILCLFGQFYNLGFMSG